MTSWSKLTLIAAVLCASGLTIGVPDAQADDPRGRREIPRNPVENVNPVNTPDDNDIEPSREDSERRLDSVDHDWHHRGFYGCYSYCDDLRDDCVTRHDDWSRNNRRRWDDRHRWNDRYGRCERRFDYCIEVCRDSRVDDHYGDHYDNHYDNHGR